MGMRARRGASGNEVQGNGRPRRQGACAILGTAALRRMAKERASPANRMARDDETRLCPARDDGVAPDDRLKGHGVAQERVSRLANAGVDASYRDSNKNSGGDVAGA